MIFYVNKENHLLWNLDTNELAFVVDNQVEHVFKRGNEIVSEILEEFSVLETVAPLKPVIRIDIVVNVTTNAGIRNVLLKNGNFEEPINTSEKLRNFMRTFNIIWFICEH